MTGKSTKGSAARSGSDRPHHGKSRLTRDSSGRFLGASKPGGLLLDQADGRLVSRIPKRIMRTGRRIPSIDPTPPEPPLTDQAREGMRRMAPVKALRWRLNMSQEEFAAAFGIPLATLKSWERRTVVPSETESAYIRLIERNPEAAKLVPV